MLGKLICLCIGHTPNRRRVWHDGMDYRAACRRCKTPMIRGRKVWRKFDPEADADDCRQPHPRMS